MVTEQQRIPRRIDQYESKKYKGHLIFNFVVLIIIFFNFLTFLNAGFMKGQIRMGNGEAIINRVVNKNFGQFANALGAKTLGGEDLLTSTQSTPVADVVIDYALGIHGFKTDNLALAGQIQTILGKTIDDNSSTQAKAIKKNIQQHSRTAQYAIVTGFNLNNVRTLANTVTLMFIAGLVILILLVTQLLVIFRTLALRLAPRDLVNHLLGALMWSAGILMFLGGVIALLPTFFNVEQVFGIHLGMFIEISTSAFLDMVIVGAVILALSIIPWAASKPK